MFLFALSSFLLGIAFSAPPGVITSEAIRRGLTGGFWPAFLVELGSLAGDAAWAVLALTGGAILVQNKVVQVSLGLGGAIFIIYLAVLAFREAFKGKMPIPTGSAGRGAFLHGMLLSLGNPFATVFWLTVGSTAITNLNEHPGAIHYILFFLSFMLGAFIWSFILAGAVSHGRRLLNPLFFRWVNILCGIFLTWFAIRSGWDTFHGLIN